MLHDPDPVDSKLYKGLINAFAVSTVVAALILAYFCFFGGCRVAHAQTLIYGYTLNQWADAIRRSEGTPTYGIKETKTTRCRTEASCRLVCLRTVANNAERFRLYGFREYPQFIEWLASRYAPTIGGGLKESERRLNQNWIHNVSYWLKKQP